MEEGRKQAIFILKQNCKIGGWELHVFTDTEVWLFFWSCSSPKHHSFVGERLQIPAKYQSSLEKDLFSAQEIGILICTFNWPWNWQKCFKVSLVFTTSLCRSVSVWKFLCERRWHQSVLLHTRYDAKTLGFVLTALRTSFHIPPCAFRSDVIWPRLPFAASSLPFPTP